MQGASSSGPRSAIKRLKRSRHLVAGVVVAVAMVAGGGMTASAAPPPAAPTSIEGALMKSFWNVPEFDGGTGYIYQTATNLASGVLTNHFDVYSSKTDQTADRYRVVYTSLPADNGVKRINVATSLWVNNGWSVKVDHTFRSDDRSVAALWVDAWKPLPAGGTELVKVNGHNAGSYRTFKVTQNQQESRWIDVEYEKDDGSRVIERFKTTGASSDLTAAITLAKNQIDAAQAASLGGAVELFGWLTIGAVTAYSAKPGIGFLFGLVTACGAALSWCNYAKTQETRQGRIEDALKPFTPQQYWPV